MNQLQKWFLIGTLIGTIMLLSVLLWMKPKEAPQFQYKKIITTQVAGNGGLIDGYEYRAEGIICLIQIQVIPNQAQVYSNLTMDCVRD